MKTRRKTCFRRVYTDRLIPVALGPIRMREDPNRPFLNTTEIGSGKIAVGKTVWGIVTWEDVDPRTKWFSIYVEGLTNAYRWKDAAGRVHAADFGKDRDRQRPPSGAENPQAEFLAARR